MCQARPGKRCKSDSAERFKSARAKQNVIGERYRKGDATREEVIEASLKTNIAKATAMSSRADWENYDQCVAFDKEIDDARGVAFDDSMRFQESADSWGLGNDSTFKDYHEAWVKNADAYLEYKSVAESPRPYIPAETQALAASKMRESKRNMDAYRTLMAQRIHKAREQAINAYGEDYINKNGVPGTSAHEEIQAARIERQRQAQSASQPLTQERLQTMMSGETNKKVLTQESLQAMMSGHPESDGFATPAGRAAGITPPPGVIPRTKPVYVPERDQIARESRREGMFGNGVQSYKPRTA